MLDVVTLECHGVRHTDCQIRDDSQNLVGADRLEGEVVRDFVDRQKGILVQSPSGGIGGEEEREREGVVGAEGESENELCS